ncbi:bifunctional Protein AATF-Bfr2/Apoptosis-antagonizing transcription factor [Babesia duncani]|uniref:Bifunctional Protein AATF-Bfr2/Apoptosis-antagonizing transcription factor n=1 Tax=Babesia duncani TaxID=323732 RepID=A0AAD9UNY1_9APIC|nr:bifunctional Protein AATF-Bfr2/Apoptosis-antagonizing transcription factor [Babesia duncani]
MQKWPHPFFQKIFQNDTDSTLNAAHDNLARLFLSLFNKIEPLAHAKINLDNPFASFDLLEQKRRGILQKLDHWNQKTSLKVEGDFEVLNQTISSQIGNVVENVSNFMNKTRIVNLPDRIIGHACMTKKLGAEGARKIHVEQIYSDQAFFVTLLKNYVQVEESAAGYLREQEQLLKSQNQDKPRMSLCKVSKARKLHFDVIEKLQNFANNYKTLTLVCPLRHGIRAIALCEQLKRRLNVVPTIELCDFLSDTNDGKNRRLEAQVRITLKRNYS